MIKGINKQIIVVKNTGSDLFEEAIFIVRPRDGTRHVVESDLAAEAMRLISDISVGQGGVEHKKPGQKLFKSLMLIMTAAAVLGIVGLAIFTFI